MKSPFVVCKPSGCSGPGVGKCSECALVPVPARYSEAQQLIFEALESAENHPVFMGHKEEGVDENDIKAEGGDAAFVTADIAWRLKEALNLMD